MPNHDVCAKIVRIIDELDDRAASERSDRNDISFAQWGLDSFTTIRLILALVVEFDIQLDPAETCRASGLDELVDLVSEKLLTSGVAR